MECGLSTSLPPNETVSLFTGAHHYQFLGVFSQINSTQNKVFLLTQVTTLFPFFWPLIASIHTGFVDFIKGLHSFLLNS